MRRLLAIGIAVAALVGAAWLVWPKKPMDDERRIREVLAQMAAAAQKKDISGVVEHLSDGYRGEGGDKQELKRLLLGYTFRSDWVSVLPANVEVKLEGQTAQVSLVVLLARAPARRAEDLPPDSILGSHAITARFAKQDGDWRVVWAERRDAGASDWLR